MRLIEQPFTEKHPVLYRIEDSNKEVLGSTIQEALAIRVFERVKGYQRVSDIPRSLRIKLIFAGFC